MKKFILLFLCFILLTPYCNAATKALQIESSLSGYTDDDGVLLANGTVAFYTNNAMSTTKNIYSDAEKTTVVSQPIALNDAGMPVNGAGAVIALFADGIYWMRLKDVNGDVVRTYQTLTYSTAADFGGLYVDIGSAYGYSSASLVSAVGDYTGTGNVTFLFNDGAFLCSATLAVPSTIKLLFTNGASLTNSGTLSLSNQLNLESNCYMANSGTLTVTGNIVAEKGAYITNSGALTLNSANVLCGDYEAFFLGTAPAGTFNTFVNLKTPSLNVSSKIDIAASGNISLSSGNITLTTGSQTISAGNMTVTTGNMVMHATKDIANYIIIKSGAVRVVDTSTTFMSMASASIFSGHIYITQQYDDNYNGSATYKVNYTVSQGWVVTAEQVTGNYFTSGHIAASGTNLQYYLPNGGGVGGHITVIGAGQNVTFSNFSN